MKVLKFCKWSQTAISCNAFGSNNVEFEFVLAGKLLLTKGKKLKVGKNIQTKKKQQNFGPNLCQVKSGIISFSKGGGGKNLKNLN